LRNIQRKTADVTDPTPAESQAFKVDEEIDMNKLIQENMQYKRIHKTLSTQVEFIENKMKDIKNEVVNLQNERKRSQANEKFLKNVLKSLTKAIGFENIAKIIEHDVEDDLEINLSNCQGESHEQLSDIKNQNLPQLPDRNYEEDRHNEKHYQTSLESQLSEQLPTDDNPQSLDRNQIGCNQNDGFAGQGLILQDHELNNILDSDNWDQQIDFSYHPSNNPQENSGRQFESKGCNSELVFCRTSSFFIGDLNKEDSFRNRFRMICESDL
jgi:hypothetical protein